MIFFVKMVLKRGKCLCNLQVFIFVLKSYAWFGCLFGDFDLNNNCFFCWFGCWFGLLI